MLKRSTYRDPKTGKFGAVGRTADGVVILRPAVPPKHFTQTQIEKTVDAVRGSSGLPDRSGRAAKAR